MIMPIFGNIIHKALAVLIFLKVLIFLLDIDHKRSKRRITK